MKKYIKLKFFYKLIKVSLFASFDQGLPVFKSEKLPWVIL